MNSGFTPGNSEANGQCPPIPGRDDTTTEFSELFDRSFAELWGYARRRVVTRADADDLTAEVFAVAWRRRDQLPPLNEQRLWLFGVARNVIRNHARSAMRQRRLFAKLKGLAEVDNNVMVDAAEQLEHDGVVLAALSRLSDDDRDLLLMRAWDRLPVGDIAAILDCTPNAVSLRLNKAKARLRDELEEKDRMSHGHEVLNPTGKGEPDDRTSR